MIGMVNKELSVYIIAYCCCANQMPKPISDTEYECFNCGKEIKNV